MRLIRFDETVVVRSALGNLDDALVDRFRTLRTQDDGPNLMRKLGLAGEDDEGVLRPTIAGLLLACRQPQDHLSHAFIQAVAYRGKTLPEAGTGPLYQLDARDITGPLDPDGLSGLETRRSTLMDRRGEGVGLILGQSRLLSGRDPVYEIFDDAELRLTIFAASFV
jgi:hypothetical protein